MTATITTNGAAIASPQVFSTPPVNVHENCMLVSWSRRSTKQNPIETADRYRGLVIDKAALTLAPDACASKFQRLLQSTVHTLADTMFQAWATENMAETQYNGAPVNIDNVLMHWAEKKAREVIDAATVLTWLESSETWGKLTQPQQAAWKIKLPKIAAPSYKGSFTTGEAVKIIARLGESEADADTQIGLFILQRLNNILGEVSQEDAL